MTSKLSGRIMKIEKRTGPVDIAKWMHLPVGEIPDWVIYTFILDRPVSPTEADLLNRDEEVGRWIELLRAADEESDERNDTRSGLVDYVERILQGARPAVGSIKRLH